MCVRACMHACVCVCVCVCVCAVSFRVQAPENIANVQPLSLRFVLPDRKTLVLGHTELRTLSSFLGHTESRTLSSVPGHTEPRTLNSVLGHIESRTLSSVLGHIEPRTLNSVLGHIEPETFGSWDTLVLGYLWVYMWSCITWRFLGSTGREGFVINFTHSSK